MPEWAPKWPGFRRVTTTAISSSTIIGDGQGWRPHLENAWCYYKQSSGDKRDQMMQGPDEEDVEQNCIQGMFWLLKLLLEKGK